MPCPQRRTDKGGAYIAAICVQATNSQPALSLNLTKTIFTLTLLGRVYGKFKVIFSKISVNKHVGDKLEKYDFQCGKPVKVRDSCLLNTE